jgi:hypothetical protein
MPNRYPASEQRLVRRVYNGIPGRGVGIDRPGVYRLVGIEGLRIFPWLVRINRTRWVLYRFIRSGIRTGFRGRTIGAVCAPRPIRAVLVLGILRMGFHELYSEDL